MRHFLKASLVTRPVGPTAEDRLPCKRRPAERGTGLIAQAVSTGQEAAPAAPARQSPEPNDFSMSGFG